MRWAASYAGDAAKLALNAGDVQLDADAKSHMAAVGDSAKRLAKALGYEKVSVTAAGEDGQDVTLNLAPVPEPPPEE